MHIQALINERILRCVSQLRAYVKLEHLVVGDFYQLVSNKSKVMSLAESENEEREYRLGRFFSIIYAVDSGDESRMTS